MYVCIGMNIFEGVMLDSRKILELKGSLATPLDHCCLVESLLALRDRDSARDALQQARAVFPEHPELGKFFPMVLSHPTSSGQMFLPMEVQENR